MYTPQIFDWSDVQSIHTQMRRHPFALLLTQHQGALHTSHLPFHLDSRRGPNGTLSAHLARANPHCEALIAGAASQVVFTGPNAYISPRWYSEPSRNVPTWNYVAIHAFGRPVIARELQTVLRNIATLTDAHEQGRAQPWSIGEAQALSEKLAAHVLAFEIPIERIEGKRKLSQNRSETDRIGVMNALREDESADAQEIALLMEALYAPEGKLA